MSLVSHLEGSKMGDKALRTKPNLMTEKQAKYVTPLSEHILWNIWAHEAVLKSHAVSIMCSTYLDVFRHFYAHFLLTKNKCLQFRQFDHSHLGVKSAMTRDMTWPRWKDRPFFLKASKKWWGYSTDQKPPRQDKHMSICSVLFKLHLVTR